VDCHGLNLLVAFKRGDSRAFRKIAADLVNCPQTVGSHCRGESPGFRPHQQRRILEYFGVKIRDFGSDL
jgi:hypothetical protein